MTRKPAQHGSLYARIANDGENGPENVPVRTRVGIVALIHQNTSWWHRLVKHCPCMREIIRVCVMN